MLVQPYLFFNGRAEEAIEFYRTALGAKVGMMLRFKESPDAPPPGMPTPEPDKIMHASFQVGDSVVMASDGCGEGASDFKGISLSLTAKEPAEAGRLFEALARGGKVEMPMTETFFSPSFGVVVDKFGVSWMVLAEPKPPA